MGILKIFGLNKPTPKEVAKDRLKFILIHDRSSITPDTIEKIREEVLQVISKYVEIDSSEVEINLTTSEEDDRSMPALVANIPIKPKN